ncbi:MAG: metallophosphoesterase family protein, partial [Chloroflexi bacterium]|nr:metallophosphoesterase family protein [Chloroflexota bacterium]
MRILVLSDIHSNLVALEAVLAEVSAFDMIWSLGDVVGYGPRPNECIARLREFEHIAIAGNHDWGVLGKADLGMFNPDARQANLWNRAQLSESSRAYLEALPETRVEGDFTLAHGSPRKPIWEYLLYPDVAKEN